jgi:hypothetical protein
VPTPVVISDVPPNATVVGNPGHPVRVDGVRPEGPDADWIHLPDPVADAIRDLSGRLSEVERSLAGLGGEQRRRRRSASCAGCGGRTPRGLSRGAASRPSRCVSRTPSGTDAAGGP